MGQRRRILIFAYFFPPLGGAGVQRIVKFAKYLPDEGWDPTIVTVRARDYWMADESLARELGPRVRVVRTGSLTGLTLLRRLAPRGRGGGAARSTQQIRRLRRWASWLLIPDTYVGWVPFALRMGTRLLARERYDWILTTSSPDSAHLIGRALTRRGRIPWLADFRDPWTRRLSFAPPTAWHRRRHRSLEQTVLREATRVTVTAPETREDYLARDPALSPEKIRVITNGYDEEDFAGLDELTPPRDRFTIVHAGQLNPERPARPFLEGLRAFLARRPEAGARTRVTFLGPCYAEDRAVVGALGLERQVRLEPPCAHREVLAALRRSHLLLLMEQDSPDGGLIIPGKVFEYLRARRPILGLLPPGAAWRLITELRAGECCRTGDQAGIARALGGFYDRFRQGGAPESGVFPERLARFERRALTRQLAESLAH